MTELMMARAELMQEILDQPDVSVRDVIPLRVVTAPQAPPSAIDQAALALQSMTCAVLIVDQERRVTYLNPEAERMTGWSDGEARGSALDEVLHLVSAGTRERVLCGLHGRRDSREDDPSLGVMLLRRDRSTVAVSDSVAPLRDAEGNVLGMVILLQDATVRRRVDRRLYYEANHDPLTGLVNRRAFERHLARMLRGPTPRRHPHALLFLDLDQFKLVNDYFGHDAGNDLLRKVSSLLRSQVRRRDVVARLGGDEFAALLESCPPQRAAGIAEDMRSSLAGVHFFHEGHRFSLGASVGLLFLPSRRIKAAEVLKTVDAACYRAKSAGGNRVVEALC